MIVFWDDTRHLQHRNHAWNAIKVALLALTLCAMLAHIVSSAAGPAGSGPIQPIDVTGQAGDASPEEAGDQSGFSLIDWNSYKKLFNKNYSSLTQQLLRQKIFMSKQIQVFLVSAKWRLSNSGYFTSINQFSDLTREEEHQKLSGDGSGYASDEEDDQDDLMDDEQARQVFLKALKDEPTYDSDSSDDEDNDESDQEHQRQRRRPTPGNMRKSLQRNKRSLMEYLQRSLSFRDLVRVPAEANGRSGAEEEEESNMNIKWVVPSNNPNYQPVEAMSFAAAAEDGPASYKVDDIPEEQIEEVVHTSSSWLAMPIAQMVSSIEQKLSSSIGGWFEQDCSSPRHGTKSAAQVGSSQVGGAKVSDINAKQKSKVRPPDEGDRVILDWRQTGCIAPPKDQRDCESCYAFSSMAYLEWALCMNQERVLTPLSVQYMVSCGPQFKREFDQQQLELHFYGCVRGRSRQAMHFVKEYGLELAAHMPYLARDSQCPVEMNAPRKTKGYIRPNVDQQIRLRGNTTRLELALKVGPVIVNFREPIDFLAYGGGMVGPCYETGGHAMLVVGHGVENDTPYLLIKNSFGTTWGMKGYFKFDRRYTQECIKDFISPRVSFPSKKAQARRVKAYLAAEQTAKADSNQVAKSDLFDGSDFFSDANSGLLHLVVT